MINSTNFKITFTHRGKPVTYSVDKMFVSSAVIKEFYRIQAQTGNRDIHQVDNKWTIIFGPPLPPGLLEIVGYAIEEAIKKNQELKI